MTSLELLVVAQVNVDLTEQANFIANDNLDAALRFLDNAAATFEFLAEHPDVGTLREFNSPALEGWGGRNLAAFFEGLQTSTSQIECRKKAETRNGRELDFS